jgi:phospholipase/lecithinase/hemolysin
MNFMKWKFGLLAAASAAFLVGCGGGGADSTSQRAGITSVKVMGDSISDSGVFKGIPTFGRMFSVQDSDSEPNTVWTERIAALLGTPQLCNFFKFTGVPTAPFTTVSGCGSYAVGDARINNPEAKGGAKSPFSVPFQLQTASSLGFKSTDLLLIDGGGNDAADLVTGYLTASYDQGASFAQITTSLIPVATLSSGLEIAGATYMIALADKLYDSVKANALDKGAERVAILNMPSITKTPKFQTVLNQISATAGPAARASLEALFMSWLEAFNTQLAKRASVDSKKVVVVDFYSAMNDQSLHPAQYGLTNVTVPVCGTLTFQACTASALSAMPPPAGATGGTNWWKTYAFSDGFHPTPLGYQLLSQLVSKSLATAGWL